jgi:hypothetical protein
MATRNAQPSAQKPASRTRETRQAITLELVTAHTPTAAQAEKMAAAFALDPVDYHAIRETTEEQIGRAAQVLQPGVHEAAMKIHLQRIVGAFVSSAYGAAQFYGNKVTQARDLTSRLANDNRDEDREGVYGFESRAARARGFAAQAGLAAYALLAAAEGAVDAYIAVTGDTWKPYEAPQMAAASVSRQTAEAELDAFS